ncbi:MAG: hypothetical protein RLZZ589_1392, partial [Cyanobacteriota bacterium]
MVHARTERSPARLHWGEGDGPGQCIELLGDGYRVGRDGSAQVRFEAAAVSREHALLERRGRHWLLRDLDSSNGLWWRGRRVRELLLAPGDRLQLAPAGGPSPWLHFEAPGPRRLPATLRAISAVLL